MTKSNARISTDAIVEEASKPDNTPWSTPALFPFYMSSIWFGGPAPHRLCDQAAGSLMAAQATRTLTQLVELQLDLMHQSQALYQAAWTPNKPSKTEKR